ncbi:MAG: hypothetical protein E7652_07550 [Ruminococcaceae bacterium]|nr:hypothetical protein [Oscillospiraceae bacterium]
MKALRLTALILSLLMVISIFAGCVTIEENPKDDEKVEEKAEEKADDEKNNKADDEENSDPKNEVNEDEDNNKDKPVSESKKNDFIGTWYYEEDEMYGVIEILDDTFNAYVSTDLETFLAINDCEYSIDGDTLTATVEGSEEEFTFNEDGYIIDSTGIVYEPFTFPKDAEIIDYYEYLSAMEGLM